MLIPIGQLIEGHPAPICVAQDALVKDALGLMIKHDFSQLPVVDGEGDLVGLISERSITRAYYLLGGVVSLLDLPVDHCLLRVDPISPEDDVFEACDLLRTSAQALVVARDGKPIGLLTSSDLTEFFRQRSEDFIRVEDVEVTLRLRTRDAFPDDDAMTAALLTALGPHPEKPNRPRREFNHLGMGELLTVMTHEQNWPRFNGMFEPLELFKLLMSRVREVRNMLAHFRGHTDPVQDTMLRYAMDWLYMRARPPQPDGDGPRRVRIYSSDVPERAPGSSRYAALGSWLRQQEPDPAGVRMSFRDLETLLGGALPASALKHVAWWSNNPRPEAQYEAWHGAGWQVANVNLTTREVVFQPLNAAPTPAAAPAPDPADAAPRPLAHNGAVPPAGVEGSEVPVA
jgi:CBS domain-containing protein